MKGQMELIGLMMIIVIAGLILAFALILASEPADDSVNERFGESIIASNFVNSLRKVHIEECTGSTVRTTYRDVVRDCASQNAITCDGRDSCTLMEETAEEILSSTLEVWGLDYRFRVLRDDQEMYVKQVDCEEDDPKEAPGMDVMSLYPQRGQAKIILEICHSNI